MIKKLKKTNSLGLTGVTAVLTLFCASDVSAQTCARQPSCAELGYTLTSTSGCIGNVLKCPFDQFKYFCTQKSDVVNKIKTDIMGSLSLNWNAKVSLSKSGYYYPSKYGFVFALVRDTGGGEIYLTINSIKFQGSVAGKNVQFYSVPVKPGDSIYIKGYGDGVERAYFVPYSGN